MTIPISNRPYQTFHVSPEDYNKVSGLTWGLSRRGYIFNQKNRIYLHRLILDAKPGEICDHINGDRLDNRRENLRIVTKCQSNQNRGKWSAKSLPKGVFARDGKYRALIRVNGKLKSLGTFTDIGAAAWAYNVAAFEAFGQYARLNKVNTFEK